MDQDRRNAVRYQYESCVRLAESGQFIQAWHRYIEMIMVARHGPFWRFARPAPTKYEKAIIALSLILGFAIVFIKIAFLITKLVFSYVFNHGIFREIGILWRRLHWLAAGHWNEQQ